MDRRGFIHTFTGGLLATPLAAGAQPARKVYRIGQLGNGPPLIAPVGKELEDTLRERGYIRGQHIVLEYCAAGATPSGFANWLRSWSS